MKFIEDFKLKIKLKDDEIAVIKENTKTREAELKKILEDIQYHVRKMDYDMDQKKEEK